MKPVYQTKFGDPEGNCMMASVASILECGLNDLPDLYMTIQANPGKHWWELFTMACEVGGVKPHYIPCVKLVQPVGFHLMSGKSPRGPWGHTVVGLGGECVHDPHPEGGGLLTLEDYIVLEFL